MCVCVCVSVCACVCVCVCVCVINIRTLLPTPKDMEYVPYMITHESRFFGCGFRRLLAKAKPNVATMPSFVQH